MRLIDADKLLDSLPKNDNVLSLDVRKAIIDAPTVDAVPVVRCKDCYLADADHVEGFMYCNMYNEVLPANGFCCCGIKEEEEK